MQKKLDDDTDKFTKEKAEMQARISDLEDKTTKESVELGEATSAQESLQKENQEMTK